MELTVKEGIVLECITLIRAFFVLDIRRQCLACTGSLGLDQTLGNADLCLSVNKGLVRGTMDADIEGLRLAETTNGLLIDINMLDALLVLHYLVQRLLSIESMLSCEDPLLEDLMNRERRLGRNSLVVLELAPHLAAEAFLVAHGHGGVRRTRDVL